MHSATDTFILPDIETDSDIKKKSRIAALIMILFWILMLGVPFFSYTFPLPEKPGILMAFGDIEGGGDALSNPIESEDNTLNKPEDVASAPQNEEEKEVSKEETTARSVQAKIKAESEEESVIETSEKAKEAKVKVVKTDNKEDLKRVEAERKAEEKAAQLKKREEAEKVKKAEEAAAKKSFSDLFSGSGSSTGNQSQGDPKGEPDQDILDGLTSGTGKIGAGLKDRGVLHEPEIDENSQKIGRIVIRVCVNSKGEVIEAKYTQKGSTSTDLELVKVAEDAAKQYLFSPSAIEKQCGTISIDFKLK